MSTATSVESESKIRVKTKSFAYRISLEWSGKRSGTMRSPSKPDMRVSSPPEFKGEPGVWTPEDLFVSALESCTMATFLAYSDRSGIPLVSYRSEAEGLLEMVERQLVFTKVVVRPVIVVAEAGAVPGAREAIHKAHQRCLVANSVRCTVLVEPSFLVHSF